MQRQMPTKKTKLASLSALQPVVLVSQLSSSPEASPKHKRPEDKKKSVKALDPKLAESPETASKSCGIIRAEKSAGKSPASPTKTPSKKINKADAIIPDISISTKGSLSKMGTRSNSSYKKSTEKLDLVKRSIASIVSPKAVNLRISTATSKPKIALNSSPSSLHSPLFLSSVSFSNSTKSKPIDPGSPSKCMVIPTNSQENYDMYGLCTNGRFSFIRCLPRLSLHHKSKNPLLPNKTRSAHKITLVLDLDETLVHCDSDPTKINHEFEFPVLFNGVSHNIFGNIRPHCISFLQKCSQKFEIVLFTASQKIYADHLASLIDPSQSWFKYRLFREACTFVGGNYIKDLDNLGRDLAKTIIVDNSPQAFGYHLNNGIPIKSWYDDSTDEELMLVYEFLETLHDVDDVR